MRYLTLFLLLLGIVTSYSPEQLQQMYREKKIEYNMNFPTSRTEEKELFLEFCNFANMVEKHNREDGSEWQGEINEFAMMTEAERNMYLGLNISAYMESLETISVDTRDEEIVDNEDDLMKSSESVDYSNKLPQVKGQGRCGSCWTFGAVAPLEYQVNRDSKKITALSEQQYLDCVAAGPNNGCKGGWSPNCYKWTRNHKNMLATQKDYPYKGKDMKCKKNVKSALTESGLVLKRTHHGGKEQQQIASISAKNSSRVSPSRQRTAAVLAAQQRTEAECQHLGKEQQQSFSISAKNSSSVSSSARNSSRVSASRQRTAAEFRHDGKEQHQSASISAKNSISVKNSSSVSSSAKNSIRVPASRQRTAAECQHLGKEQQQSFSISAKNSSSASSSAKNSSRVSASQQRTAAEFQHDGKEQQQIASISAKNSSRVSASWQRTAAEFQHLGKEQQQCQQLSKEQHQSASISAKNSITAKNSSRVVSISVKNSSSVSSSAKNSIRVPASRQRTVSRQRTAAECQHLGKEQQQSFRISARTAAECQHLGTPQLQCP
ncbi:hypothetical protein ACHWQZ_G005315 [Mnemiopsis leidyi]